ncbi:hypothetical protein V6N13_026648 [Hibiscus sabdariffa]
MCIKSGSFTCTRVNQGENGSEAQVNKSGREGSAQLNKDKPKSNGKASVKEEEFDGQKKKKAGVMSSICKTSIIISRLQSWGLGEINVKSMGGQRFLLSFAEDELFTMLEDLEGSYLKEIFVDVYPWTKSKSDGTSYVVGILGDAYALLEPMYVQKEWLNCGVLGCTNTGTETETGTENSNS